MAVEKPWFVLVAGINGAGKSTIAQDPQSLQYLAPELGRIEIINPDKVTQDLRRSQKDLTLEEANLAAARACESRVDQLILAAGHSFAIETVLSTDKYRGRIVEAKRRGFRVLFVYMMLDSVEQAIQRVRLRVKRGGHDVPESKIRKRWPLSRENLPWYWANSDLSFVYFNDTRLQRLAERGDEVSTFHDEPPQSARPVMRKLLPRWAR